MLSVIQAIYDAAKAENATNTCKVCEEQCAKQGWKLTQQIEAQKKADETPKAASK